MKEMAKNEGAEERPHDVRKKINQKLKEEQRNDPKVIVQICSTVRGGMTLSNWLSEREKMIEP